MNARSFCVTNDELFMIPDYGEGNIKIYEKNGEILELISTIGRKGYSPEELARPTFCFYNKNESKFGNLDFGIRKIFIYDRIGRIEFKRVDEVFCWRGGTDIKLIGDKLFIAGYISDQKENPYDFYYIDLTNLQITYLLPSYYKYCLKSFQEYEIQYRKKPDIPTIGINGWFDIHEDNAYFVWEGNLKIIKLNIDTGKIEPKHFGRQPPRYVKPYASQKLIDSHVNRDFNTTLSERAKMSFVRNIFATSKYVLVIYEGPINQSSATNFRLQFYTLDGDFIKDMPIPGKPDRKMWFDKDSHILYSLSSNSDKSGEHYFILKYEIH